MILRKVMIVMEKLSNLNIRVDSFYFAENQVRLLVSKERMEKAGGTIHELIDD